MTSTANIPETELFEKALEVLNAAPASSFTTATTNDNDSKKLADDAVQVYVSFYSTSDQLALVDSQNGTTWKRQWDGLCSRYRELLEDTKVLAREGSDYIANFQLQVAGRLNKTASGMSADAKLFADFIQLGDRLIAQHSSELSQKFADLSVDVNNFNQSFAAYAGRQGIAYNESLAALHRETERLQEQINFVHSQAAQLEKIGNAILASLQMIAELRRQKDRVARQAAEVAIQATKLQQVQSTLSILSQDVVDISNRLSRLTYLWSSAHGTFVQLQDYLEKATHTTSPVLYTLFERRISIVLATTAIFTSDMQLFADSLGDLSDISGHIGYVLSPQYGGSDVSQGSLFNDARTFDLDAQRPISKVVITSGWVVDGIKITYRLKNGQTQVVAHGVTGYATDTTLTLNDNEYISAAIGKSGVADNGQPFMGDCVQQLQLEITNSKTGAKRTYGPFGTAPGLSESAAKAINWSGRLLAFAGRANDAAVQVGLRGISFVQQKSY